MKFNIITFGCKVNMYESNYISESLVNNGFSFCEELNQSDIVIINTCSVTDTSDKKCLKMVRRIKRENPKAILVICGCSSQNNCEPYKDLGANIIIGNRHKSTLVELIKDYLVNKTNYCNIESDRDIPFEEMSLNNFNQVRAYIKVQDGCNNFCSYCIIPFVRGNIRSKAFETINEEVTLLAKKGFKEIVLTGIHTGSYNDNGKDLCDVIEMISKIDGIKRVRLSSVEITELNDKFMTLLKNNKVLCNHLHIPLQAGSDEILKSMHRKYDLNYFENKIKEIRSIRPDISITTDVIVGFPDESDDDFNETCEFSKEIGFSKIHVFPYSRRSGTKADTMPNQVDEIIKKERVNKLIEVSNKLEKEYMDSFINKEVEVLIEKNIDNKSVGHTGNYLKVEVDGNIPRNTFVKVMIKERINDCLKGERND